MNNPYQLAIQNEESSKFILGQDQYYYLDHDRGIHDPTRTGMYLLEYEKLFGSENLLQNLNADVKKILLNDSVTLQELQTILSLFFFYCVYHFEEKKFQQKWNISLEIKKRVAELITKFNSLKPEVELARSLIERLTTRFNFFDTSMH